MKAVKGTKRKYYKNFIQPILSANGTMGENAFACNQSNYFDNTKLAWKCFDNSFQPADRWQVNNVNTGNWYWVSWYNPTPLNITSLTIYNAQSPYVVKAYKIQGSDDNSNWVDIKTGTNTNTTEYTSWTISISGNPLFYKYHRIYCQPNNSTSIQISEIQITANYESTESDYDFYKDVYAYKAVKETIRKYYKYGTTYTMPNMTSNTTPSGTVSLLSGSLYGVHESWEMFNSSDANAFIQPSSSSYSVRYIFDSPLQGGEGSVSGYYSQDNPKGSSYKNRTLTSYNIALNYSDGSTEVIKSWSGSTTSVTHMEASYVANKDIVSIDFAFTGGIDVYIFGILYDFTLTHTPIIEGTAQDYDFYEDVDFYKVVKF